MKSQKQSPCAMLIHAQSVVFVIQTLVPVIVTRARLVQIVNVSFVVT